MVPRKPDGQPPGRRPLTDDELADQLLGKAQAEGVEMFGDLHRVGRCHGLAPAR
jgi:hypothetical protein